MALPVETFDQSVASQQAQMSAATTAKLDFTTGSILAAITESNAGNFMWLQAIATALLAFMRLSTSSGPAVDSFINQFHFFRYLGNPSTGNVTFSRNTATQAASIPVGTIVSVSAVNNLNFIVTLDAENPLYDAATNSYIIPALTESGDVPVQCQQTGTVGNVIVGAIDTINSQLVYVDFVTNAQGFTNGIAQWDDDTTKIQFVNYLASLSRATKAAIDYAVSVTPGPPNVARFNTVENENHADASEHLGYFYVVVDDGTGVENPTLITNVTNQVEFYRGLTIAFDVIGPEVTTVNVSCTITLIPSPTETEEEIELKIVTALETYITALSFNSLLPYTRLAEIIYDADANILNVTSILLNAGTADLTTDNTHIFVPGTIAVTFA